jgi:hypothetical protein
MHLVELSSYVPQLNYTPPIPEWKKFDDFRDALPDRDQVEIRNESLDGKTKKP